MSAWILGVKITKLLLISFRLHLSTSYHVPATDVVVPSLKTSLHPSLVYGILLLPSNESSERGCLVFPKDLCLWVSHTFLSTHVLKYILLIQIFFGVGIAQRYSTWLWAAWLGVRVPVGAGNILPRYRVQTGSGGHPASYPIGIRGYFPGVKRPECEADHSPPSSDEVKNEWSYTSNLQIRLQGVMLS
jgi:hypothetical protein